MYNKKTSWKMVIFSQKVKSWQEKTTKHGSFVVHFSMKEGTWQHMDPTMNNPLVARKALEIV